MRDVLPEIKQWIGTGESIALAVVVQTWGSAPRRPGAHMAITQSGKFAGSVSGGCVEVAVIEAATTCLNNQTPALLTFGVADERAWEVGLACGGEISVFVFPLPSEIEGLFQSVEARQPVGYSICIASKNNNIGEFQVISGPDIQREPQVTTIKNETWFTNPIVPSPEIILIGGGQISQALTQLARTIGYAVHIIEPRRALATPTRFSAGTRISQAWPNEVLTHDSLTPDTALLALTHDPKIDDPALLAALNSPVFYIGALGSKATQGERIRRLSALGVSAQALERVHGPAGWFIGAYSPEEIALSMLVEIVAMRNLSGDQTKVEKT